MVPKKPVRNSSGRKGRPRAKLPTWAAVLLLILAAYVAITRATDLDFLGGRDAPIASTSAAPTSVGTVAPAAAPTLPTATFPTATFPTATFPTATFPSAALPTSGTDATAAPVFVVADAIPADADPARVTRVVDGDTVEVSIDGELERVRYLGLDTPERDDPGYVDATNANAALVENAELFLARDVTDRDDFGRLLRHLYLEDGTHVNATLVAQGWAQPVEYSPDTTFAEDFWDLALEAAAARRGFWAGTVNNGTASTNGADTAGANSLVSFVDGPMPYGVTVREVPIRNAPDAAVQSSNRAVPATPLTIYARTPAGDWLDVRPPSRRSGWVPADAVDLRVPLDAIPTGE